MKKSKKIILRALSIVLVMVMMATSVFAVDPGLPSGGTEISSVTKMAGNIFMIGTDPCFQRKYMAIRADGIKNSRLIWRAVAGSAFRTSVSHKISRLPPPIPRPERKPSTVPISSVTSKLSSTGTGHLPKGSWHPDRGGAISAEFVCPGDPPTALQGRCRGDRGVRK